MGPIIQRRYIRWKSNSNVSRIIFKERLAENEKMGEYMMKRLKKIREDYEIIGDVRGKGLMIGAELVKDRKTKTPAKAERDSLIIEAFKKDF